MVDDVGGSDPCPHPYLPLLKGARWSYQLGDDPTRPGRAELEVLNVETKGRGLTAHVKRTVGASVTTVEATCSPEGTSFLTFFIPLGPPLPVELNYVPRISKSVGVLLGPPNKLRSGQHWNYDLVAHTENPGGKALSMDSEWRVEVSYAGEEIVTVPAGRYDVKQIKLRVTGHHRPPEEEDVTFSERVMDPPSMGFTYSLAKGVGVVLIDGEPLEGPTTKRARWSLTGLKRPGR